MITTAKRKTPLSDEVTTVLPVTFIRNDPEKGLVFGEALMDEVVKEPTLDRYLDGNPKIIMPNYEEMVALLQKKRALFITSEQKKKEPKIEGDESEVQD